MKYRLLFLIPLIAALLQGCLASNKDNDDDATNASVRLLNLASDVALDLYASDTRLVASVANRAISDHASASTGSATLKLKGHDSGTTLLALAQSLAASTQYTVVALPAVTSQLQALVLTESETTPSSGYAKIRVINAASKAGNLDVYLTAADTSLANATPIEASLSGAGSFVDAAKGSYRLRLTAAGDKTDVRLDVAALALADQAVVNLIVTPTAGGVLVDAYGLVQGGALTAYRNSQARIRLAASAAANGAVSATINGVALATNLSSPAVGAYAQVPGGALAVELGINGATVDASGLTAEAGGDYTLLAMGSATASTVRLLSDDNAPASSGYASIRLVNGINDGASLSLLLDYAVIASDIATGRASTAASVTYGSGHRLDVMPTASNVAIYTNGDTDLLSSKVYSLFVLGDSGNPVGILRRDR